MQVRLAGEFLAGGGTDDMRDHAAFGRTLDAEIAVLEEGAQAALEAGVAGMGGDEALGRHGLPFVEGVTGAVNLAPSSHG